MQVCALLRDFATAVIFYSLDAPVGEPLSPAAAAAARRVEFVRALYTERFEPLARALGSGSLSSAPGTRDFGGCETHENARGSVLEFARECAALLRSVEDPERREIMLGDALEVVLNGVAGPQNMHVLLRHLALLPVVAAVPP